MLNASAPVLRMKRPWILILLVAGTLFSQGQNFKAINNQVSDALNNGGKFHEMLKISLNTGFRTGTTLGVSYGMWKEGPVVQYSLNTGFMWRFGKYVLGNYRNGSEPGDPRSKSQFNFMISPLLTTRLSGKDYDYQEIEPFYWGTATAIFNKYRHSLTAGTTFTISPRAYKQVATIRNRAQQVFVVALNIRDFNLTIYDDYFPFATEYLQLGDNWDRFYTGGGFLRYRFSDELTMHVYSEVYTGINRVNHFLYPDIISYWKKGDKWIRKNMANQDPGQEFFNYSWFFAKMSYSSNSRFTQEKRLYEPAYHLSLGTAASWTMFSQNWIHNMFKPDKENDLRLHYFLHRTNVPGNLQAGGSNAASYIKNGFALGTGASYNLIKF